MTHSKTLRRQSPLLLFLCLFGAIILAGCSDSKTSDTGTVNPIGAYMPTSSTTSQTPTNGQTQGVGKIDTPIVTVPIPTDGRSDHNNAPLLSNYHPGWQQADCFSCHTDQSRIPDHSYPDTSMCYLCHGTNGLPGFGDATPPIISGITAAPTSNGVTIAWRTDEPCISRLILRTKEGDRLEFPVSLEYVSSHKYTVTGLLYSTMYTYEIVCIDRNNNTTTSATMATLSFTTLAQSSSTGGGGTSTNVPQAFFGPISVKIEDSFSIRVNWTCIVDSKCSIHMMDDLVPPLHKEFVIDGPSTSFNERIYNLQASTTYQLWITAKETVAGISHTSSKQKFTLPPP